jgi:hypothetical protein
MSEMLVTQMLLFCIFCLWNHLHSFQSIFTQVLQRLVIDVVQTGRVEHATNKLGSWSSHHCNCHYRFFLLPTYNIQIFRAASNHQALPCESLCNPCSPLHIHFHIPNFSLYGLKLLLCSGLTTLEQSDNVQNLHAHDINLWWQVTP